MLIIDVDAYQFFDQSKDMFFETNPQKVRLEHSLISIAKWEAIWKKPYLPSSLQEGLKGPQEELSYLSCMVIGNVSEYIPLILMQNHSDEIRDYIDDPHTATTIHRIGATPPSTKTVTAELIYYWMIKFGVPFECDRWHFNRLLMLIDVCNVQEQAGQKGGKLSRAESARYRDQLNKKRRGLMT